MKVPINLYNVGNMNITLKYLIVADSVIMDRLTNKISAIGIFDKVSKRKGIPPIINFSVAGQVLFDGFTEQELKVVVDILDPDSNLVKRAEVIDKEIQKKIKSNSTIPFIFRFDGIELKKVGVYKIKMQVNDIDPKIEPIKTFDVVDMLDIKNKE